MVKTIKKAIGMVMTALVVAGVSLAVLAQTVPIAEAVSRGMMDIEGNYDISWSWGDYSPRFKIGGGMFGQYPYTYQGVESTPDGYGQYYLQANDIDGNYTSWIIKSCQLNGHFEVKIYKYADDGSVVFQGKGTVVY